MYLNLNVFIHILLTYFFLIATLLFLISYLRIWDHFVLTNVQIKKIHRKFYVCRNRNNPKPSKGLNSYNNCGEHLKWVSRYGLPAGSVVCAHRACAHSLFAHLSTHAQRSLHHCSTRAFLSRGNCWLLRALPAASFIYIDGGDRTLCYYEFSSASFVLPARGWLWYDNWWLSVCRVMFRDVTWWKLSDDQIDTVIGILLTDKRRHGRCAGKCYQAIFFKCLPALSAPFFLTE